MTDMFPPHERAAISTLAASRIREIANAGMGRNDIATFWFGESDLPTPEFIIEAARNALAEQKTFYTQNLGRPDLRAAIAAYSTQLHGTGIDMERIGVTGSGVSALMLAAQLVVSPADRVIVVTPIWPNIAEIPKILGAQVERFPLTIADDRWTLDLEALIARLTPDIKMLVINAPNNPTGFTLDAQSQKALLEHCRKLGIWVLSDEVYERLVFDGAKAAPSMLAHAEPEDRLIVVNSFSKTWRMTGWRIGWLTLPAQLMPALEKIVEYNTSCVPGFVQDGALAALTRPEGEDEVSALRAGLEASRRLLLDGLASTNRIAVPETGGAMYGFFRIDGFDDDMALARALVAEAALGLAPGSAFGSEGAGWLRWCFAAQPEKIADGLERLNRFLAR